MGKRKEVVWIFLGGGVSTLAGKVRAVGVSEECGRSFDCVIRKVRESLRSGLRIDGGVERERSR